MSVAFKKGVKGRDLGSGIIYQGVGDRDQE